MDEEKNQTVIFEFDGELQDLTNYIKGEQNLDIVTQSIIGKNRFSIIFVDQNQAAQSLFLDKMFVKGFQVNIDPESYINVTNYDPEELENVRRAVLKIIHKYVDNISDELFDDLIKKLYLHQICLLSDIGKKPRPEKSFFGRRK